MRIIKLNNQIKKRFIFLLIIFACFSTSIFLISYSLKDQIAYFVEPTDLKSMDGIENKYLRVGGLAKINSLKFLDGDWTFEVIDQNQNRANHDGDPNRSPQILFSDPHQRPHVIAQE